MKRRESRDPELGHAGEGGPDVVGATKDLTPGQSETLTADIPAGNYVLFCSLPGHESLGLKGSLTVTK